MIKLTDYVIGDRINYDLLESICYQVAGHIYSVRFHQGHRNWKRMHLKATRLGMKKSELPVPFLAEKLKHRLYIEFLRDNNNLDYDAKRNSFKHFIDIHGKNINTLKKNLNISTSRAINIRKFI